MIVNSLIYLTQQAIIGFIGMVTGGAICCLVMNIATKSLKTAYEAAKDTNNELRKTISELKKEKLELLADNKALKKLVKNQEEQLNIYKEEKEHIKWLKL